MSEMEKVLAGNIANMVKVMPENMKQRLLGVAEGMVIGAKIAKKGAGADDEDADNKA